jgi:hypothetical protein
MDRLKDAVVTRLAEAHFALDPGIERIVRLLTSPDREADPREPIKLLEVNSGTTASGIQPLYFGPHPASGVFYPSVIVAVTPEEYEQILREPQQLPEGWTMGTEYERPAAVR